jgi:serine/threonine protein kinase
MGQQEVQDMFLYYGLKKTSIDVNKDIAKWDDPNYFCSIMEKMFPASCTKKYTFVSYLGKGAFGHVYEIRDKTNGKRGAVKFQLSDDPASIKRELAMQKKLHSIGVAPAVWDHCSMKTSRPSAAALKDLQKRLRTKRRPEARGQDLHMTMMEKVDGTVSKLLQTKQTESQLKGIKTSILSIVDKMRRHKISHGDLHWDNIAYRYTGHNKIEIRVIDTGYTTDKVHRPEYDYLQLYRCLDKAYEPKMNESNRKDLRSFIRRHAYHKYKFTLPKDQNKTEELWETMTDKFHSRYL